MKRLWTLRNGLALTSAAFTLAVGVVAALQSVLAADGPRVPVVWWVTYAGFGVLLLMVQDYLPRPRRLPRSALLIGLIALGVTLVLLFATEGSTALLFVMTATMASFFWPARAVAGLVVVQTGVVLLAGALGGWPIEDLVVGFTVFGISQVFGMLVVFSARSEAEARRELAVAHAELRSTTTLLQMSTREAERLRIARELHDLLGHQLTALSLELEVASHLTAESAGADNVRRARSLTKELLRTVRAAVSEMRMEVPPLNAALRELAGGVPTLDIHVEMNGEPRVTLDQTVAIVRCAQEAITNTLRHSDARSSRIRVDADEKSTRVTVTDDGHGTSRVVAGHGLTGMRERIELLGGTLSLSSSAGAGFTVTATLPTCDGQHGGAGPLGRRSSRSDGSAATA